VANPFQGSKQLTIVLFPWLSLRSNHGLKLANAFGVNLKAQLVNAFGVNLKAQLINALPLIDDFDTNQTFISSCLTHVN
jgi:hypothetical protein